MTDIVLKDQLVVYDNEKQRLGWKPYDCKALSLLLSILSLSTSGLRQKRLVTMSKCKVAMSKGKHGPQFEGNLGIYELVKYLEFIDFQINKSGK